VLRRHGAGSGGGADVGRCRLRRRRPVGRPFDKSKTTPTTIASAGLGGVSRPRQQCHRLPTATTLSDFGDRF